jgi:hypothetical protein
VPEVVDLAQQELGGLDAGEPVEGRHLIEAARHRALGGCAVVADDVVIERVVEVTQVVQGVDQDVDVVVGVLQEAGVDLHLPLERRLELVRHVVPVRDLVGRRRQLRVLRDDAERLLPGERLLAQGVLTWPRYLSDHSAGTWCGAWVAPGAKYMKYGLPEASAVCWSTQVTARSVMSAVKW